MSFCDFVSFHDGRAAAPEVKPKRGGVAAYQKELMSR